MINSLYIIDLTNMAKQSPEGKNGFIIILILFNFLN